jgi:cardiolipin synthase
MEQKDEATELKDIGTLLFKSRAAVRWVNLITLYRIITFPLLLYLALRHDLDVFKWLLLASFFTDAIDGFLARKYKATSILGAKLDSIGDDLTVLAAAVGLFVFHFDFIKEEAVVFIVLFALFLFQVGLSFYRYKKISTFHTYLAKIAAVVTALFLLSVFFAGKIYYPLFYAAAIITGIELVEEIILAAILKDYKSNVKGLYWVFRPKQK